MLRIWGILVFSFVVISGYSQDQYGLSTGQYAGIDGLRLNPSAISGSAYYMDIKLLGSSFLLTNNYVFLPRESYSPFMLLRSNPEFKQFTDELGHDRYLDEKYDTRLKNAYLGIDINGPGAMVQLGRHAAGITTAFRSRLYAKNIPYEIAKFGYESFDYDSLYDINFINEKDVHLDQINYLDIGFTYSYIAYARNRDKLDMGVTLHYLKPQSAFKLYFDRMDYLLPDGDSLIIFDLDGDIKMSLPVSYDDNSYPDGSGFFKGSGLGLDVGFTYTKTIRFQSRYDRFARPCRQKQYDYQYRMAVALLDVGWVSMKKNVYNHHYENIDTIWGQLGEMNFNNITQVMETISTHFYGDSLASATNETAFTLRLPTALSMQFDYNLDRNWFITTSGVFGFPSGPKALSRPTTLAVIPRYETPDYGFRFPIGLYDYKRFRLGAALRFYNLTVGTDNLAHYVGMADIDGLDFYFSLKFQLVKGQCGGSKYDDCAGQEYGIGRKRR